VAPCRSRPHGNSAAPSCGLSVRTRAWIGVRTIIKIGENTVNDPSALALRSIAWIVSDEARAERFLALTGLTPDLLRERLGRVDVQRAALEFLCAHEPDLLAAAEALDVSPAGLAAAGERLGA